MIKNSIFAFLAFILLTCCAAEDKSLTVRIEPSKQIVNEIPKNDFSIVLDDMTIKKEGSFINHQHKYKVYELKEDSLHVSSNNRWQTVNESFFEKHENDLGMEISSRHSGKLSSLAQPLGFGWAIGNEAHGEWEEVKKDSTSTASNSSTNDTSNRRWRTHATSPFLWLWLGSRRSFYRNDYNSYRSFNNRGFSYYGSSASTTNTTYGTRSNYQKKTRSNFFTRKSKNSSNWNNFKSKKSSRYSSGSSTRSRSGGKGK